MTGPPREAFGFQAPPQRLVGVKMIHKAAEVLAAQKVDYDTDSLNKFREFRRGENH